MYILIITGVQASKVIIDCLLRQCCFILSVIEGQHSSGNFNDWKKLSKDAKEVKEEKNIFVKADKTTNCYKTEPNDYVTLVDKNITKTYKKTLDMITLKDKIIAEKLELADRIEASAPRDSFITLKDHKPNFINNPTSRLISPCKSEIGIISKNILDGINHEITQATKVNLWKRTKDTIEWFKDIPEKEKHAFITFDVCDFYPSISEDLLLKALNYASRFTTITQQDHHIITHAKKSLL